MAALVELSTGELAFGAIVLLLAAFIRGYSGFGFSAVLVAGATFVVEPAAAVPLAITFEVFASLIQVRSVRDEVRWHDFRLLFLAAIVGNPVGILILTTVDADRVRALTLGVLLVLTIGLLSGRNSPLSGVQPTPLMVFAVGVVAGVVNGATALSGLVLVLAMAMAAIPAAGMRATLVVYFFASNLVVIGLLAIGGELSDELFWRVLFGIPLLVVGVFAGSKAFRAASDVEFRRVTLWLLVAISLAGLGRLLVT